jgi:hypothetical protein
MVIGTPHVEDLLSIQAANNAVKNALPIFL